MTVFPALVQLTLIACVTGLAATLGLPPSIEETATTVEALQGAGPRPRGCSKNSSEHRKGMKGRGSQRLKGRDPRVPGKGVRVPSGGGVGEGTGTQVPLSSLFPLGQVQTGPLGLSRHSHSHFLRSQGLVTVGVGRVLRTPPFSLTRPSAPRVFPLMHLQAACVDGTRLHQRRGSDPQSG